MSNAVFINSKSASNCRRVYSCNWTSHIFKSVSTEIWIEMENSDISISFFKVVCHQNGNLRHFENVSELFIERNYQFKYRDFFYIPNGLRYLIPSGHYYFNAVDLNISLSVGACSRLQWPQELWALLRVVSPRLQWSLGTHRGNGSETSVVSRTSTFPLLATFLNGLTCSSK